MAEQALPTRAQLRQLLEYDPASGRLFWKPRTAEMCPERALEMWNKRFAGTEAFKVTCPKGYKKGKLFNRHLKAHRVIWAMHFDEWPEQIDHVNGDKADNRIENLRASDQSDNMRNRPLFKSNKTGAHGVYPRGDGRFWAEISHNKRREYLGTFASLEEARAARLAAEQRLGFHPNHGREAA
jgi:hypothetical protein